MRRVSEGHHFTSRRQFLYGAQLERMVNPLMGPMRHTSRENRRGRVNTFLFERL